MNRIIDQMNVSITTNRSCTLRCEHCYIAPILFKSKDMISIENFKLVFDKVEELLKADIRLKFVEWEVIGGETTMMPIAFWEELLPWSLDKVSYLNKKYGAFGSLNFLTNLIFSDKKYIDLFNKYGDHPFFTLYTSWEPDTNRFGANNKLFPQFLTTLSKLKVQKITLDLILTKGLVAFGAKKVLDLFLPYGVTDFSIKMLSPFGSGKDFINHNMTSFKDMADFILEFKKLAPPHITFTPVNEMQTTLHKGQTFQCNGNFYYDLTIEPNGLCSFNANQTGEEAIIPEKPIFITDLNWSSRIIFENTSEAWNKLNLIHESCHQCEHLKYCNAGWYHYKVFPEYNKEWGQEECPGFKKVWDQEKQLIGSPDLINQNHLVRIKNSLKKYQLDTEKYNLNKSINESEIVSLNQNIFDLDLSVVTVDYTGLINGKNLAERLIYYDAKQILTKINYFDCKDYNKLDTVIFNIVCKCYKFIVISTEDIIQFISDFPDNYYSKLIIDSLACVYQFKNGKLSSNCLLQANNNGLIVDQRNEEILSWVFSSNFEKFCPSDLLKKLSLITFNNIGKGNSLHDLERIETFLISESLN